VGWRPERVFPFHSVEQISSKGPGKANDRVYLVNARINAARAIWCPGNRGRLLPAGCLRVMQFEPVEIILSSRRPFGNNRAIMQGSY
jgi:hypothetical protein